MLKIFPILILGLAWQCPTGFCRLLHSSLNNYLGHFSTHLSPNLQQMIIESKQLPFGMMTSGTTTVGLLMNLLRMIRAEKVLDVGTFGGVSAVAMASVLPQDCTLVTMDITETFWKQVGEKYANKENVAHKIMKMLKVPANITMDTLIKHNQKNQFDFCYIDADKISYPQYYEQCLTLVRPYGIIAMDNVMWDGKVVNARAHNDSMATLFHQLNQRVSRDDRVWYTLLAVGDGMGLAVKKP